MTSHSSTHGNSEAHRISIVIPVYQGETTLPALMKEIEPFTKNTVSGKHAFIVTEVVLVHDNGPDRSDVTMQTLSEQYSFVRPVWLSRNFGQHPATLAGMSSTSGDWVITMDEDGQQDPADIAEMLKTALEEDVQIVYGSPKNPPPHGFLRNTLSNFAKWISAHLLGNGTIGRFNSFRLVDGEIARSLAAYCGHSVFLDVALFWVGSRAAYCPVTLREEMGRPSGYSFKRLMRHFWQLILTSGTKPLRLITFMGIASIFLGLALTAYALYVKFGLKIPVQGWASIVIVVSFFSGCILFSLGIIAEYLAVALTIVMGKPLYLVVSKPSKRRDSTNA